MNNMTTGTATANEVTLPSQVHEPDRGRMVLLTTRREQAITALVWLGVVFFLGAIAISVYQAISAGSGLFIGDNVQYDHLPMPTGDPSIWSALLGIGVTALFCYALIGAWTWVVERIGGLNLLEAPDDSIPGSELKDEDFYIVNMPRTLIWLTRTAVTCIVLIVLTMVVLVPLIFIKYGWVWQS